VKPEATSVPQLILLSVNAHKAAIGILKILMSFLGIVMINLMATTYTSKHTTHT